MILIIIIEFTVVKNIVFKIIASALFLGSLLTGLYTFLVNPGVTFKEEESNNQNEKNFYCKECNFTYPKNEKKYLHCYACGVCAPNSDHHCGVFGKCIAKKNANAFYLFLVSIISIICYFLVAFTHAQHNIYLKNYIT